MKPSMKIKPLADRIIVRRIPESDVSRGGIIIPQTAQERPLTGKVLAVGPGRRLENGILIPLDILPGDTVMFGKFSGTQIKEIGEGDDLLVLKEEDVHGVIESE